MAEGKDGDFGELGVKTASNLSESKGIKHGTMADY